MKSKKLIWIVEDDSGTQFIYREILNLKYGFEIFSKLSDFLEAIKRAERTPDLLIADLRLGNESFLSFLGNPAHSRKIKFPFFIVSSIDDLDILRGCFEKGAVDCLTKPFSKNELLLKIERLFSRGSAPLGAQKPLHKIDSANHGSSKSPSKAVEIVFDPSTLTLRRGATEVIQLTAKELQLYAVLYRAGGEKVPRKQLEVEIWGRAAVTSKSLDVHIFNLRKKIAQFGIEILYSAPDGYFLNFPK